MHRIDKDTTGLLLVAKSDAAHQSLSAQIAAHTVGRVYLALLQGRLKQDEGDVDAPIGRHPTDRKRMAIVAGGREAQTHYRVLAQLNGATLIEARLRTGRTHQIRVHMASLGHPVLGDPLYGPHKCPVAGLDHQLLHACRIAFDHPADGVRRVFAVEPPLFVELEVTDTEPGFKGDTATGATKPATVETGATVQVPLFVETGDKLKIDTRTGEYLSRV